MPGNARRVQAYPPANNVIALLGVTTGNITSTPSLVLQPFGANNMEWESLVATVVAGITTSSLVVAPQWQVSQDNTTWRPIFPMNNAAYVAFATGTGVLVTTTINISLAGINPSYPYLRFAVLSTAATGTAGDNVTVTYNWTKRFGIGG